MAKHQLDWANVFTKAARTRRDGTATRRNYNAGLRYTLSEAQITLRKQRWVLILAIVTGLAYGIYGAMSQPRLYTSTGRIQVRSGSLNEYRVTAATELGGNDVARRMLTEVNIIQSNAIMPMEIDVIDPGMPAANPTLQPASTIVLTRLILGLMAGIVIAFLLESLDRGLRSISKIEGVTELPSLAIIPQVRRITPEQGRNLTAAQRNIAVLTMPKSQFSESFRSLRTSLMLTRTRAIHRS